MKYQVRETGHLKCHITLIPENDIEKKLLIINNEDDENNKEYTFQVHYQNAIAQKIGPKALLNNIVKENYPVKVFARYIIEGGSIGNY